MRSVLANSTSQLHVRVAAIEPLGPKVRAFTLIASEGECLPAFIAGSHVLVTGALPGDFQPRYYSLTSSPRELDHYQIVVGKGTSTNGLSSFLHEHIEVGSMLEISHPVGGMALGPQATKHLLVAGGMGVTPFLSHLAVLAGSGVAYELHYTYPTTADELMLPALKELPPGVLFTYASREGARLDTDRLLAAQPDGTHVYVCGPQGLVEGVIGSAWRLGLPLRHIHFESGMKGG